MKKIYLDHNATTPLHQDVKNSIIDALDVFGNASSMHMHGYLARERIESVRDYLYSYIHCSEGRIIFTSSGSESNNLVLKGLVCEGPLCAIHQSLKTKPHVLTTSIEHPSVLNTLSCVGRNGIEISTIPVDSYGMIAPEDVLRQIKPNTVLVSVMMANNEVGTILPVMEIGIRLKEKGIPFHCDAVQALGKFYINVDDLHVDYLSVSGHKINAPKGIGALYIRRNMTLCPLIHGGHQELNLRAGTENNLGIIAFGKALEVAEKDRASEVERVRALRDRFHQTILASLPGVHLNGHPELRLPGTLNLSFDKIDGAALLEMMAAKGISASSGSACSSGQGSASHVLTAMGLSPERVRSAVRFSFGYGNTEQDIDDAAKIVVDTVKKLRAISPL